MHLLAKQMMQVTDDNHCDDDEKEEEMEFDDQAVLELRSRSLYNRYETPSNSNNSSFTHKGTRAMMSSSKSSTLTKAAAAAAAAVGAVSTSGNTREKTAGGHGHAVGVVLPVGDGDVGDQAMAANVGSEVAGHLPVPVIPFRQRMAGTGTGGVAVDAASMTTTTTTAVHHAAAASNATALKPRTHPLGYAQPSTLNPKGLPVLPFEDKALDLAVLPRSTLVAVTVSMRSGLQLQHHFNASETLQTVQNWGKSSRAIATDDSEEFVIQQPAIRFTPSNLKRTLEDLKLPRSVQLSVLKKQKPSTSSILVGQTATASSPLSSMILNTEHHVVHPV